MAENMTLFKESGMNKCIDLLAPGENLLTTEQGGGVFTEFSRTSAAAAFASGAIALVLQFYKDNNIEIKAAELRSLLKETASFDFPNAVKCQSNLFGCGIINPTEAINKTGLPA
jgi:subtilisin family serine protease